MLGHGSCIDQEANGAPMFASHLRTVAGTVPSVRLVVPLFALNLADAVFTVGWIELRLAHEANPLMAQPLGLGVPTFLVVKLGLVLLGLYLLYRRVEQRLAQVGLGSLFLVYASLLCYHLWAMQEFRSAFGL